MKKVLISVLVLGLGLTSCEKPELINEEMNFEVKGWSSDILKENNSKTSKTSKSNTVDYTLEVYGEQDVLEVIGDVTIYESLIVEGDINSDDFTILGSVAYHIDPIEDVLIASITRNDKDGNILGETEHIESDSYEIVFK